MKIAFLLTQSIDSPSGLGRYFPLARQLVRLGHSVTILALHPDFAALPQKTEQVDGVSIVNVSQMHVRKRGSSKSYFSTPTLLFHTALATWRLTLAAIRLRADIIQVCKPHPMNGVAGWIAHKLHRSQLWLDCDDYEAASGRFNRAYQRKVVAWFERTLPRHAFRITTNTHFMQGKLVAWGVDPARILYLPNGVDRERFSAPSSSELRALRTQLGLPENPLLLYIGSLSLPSHPLPLLIEAFRIVLQSNPAARLVIVGGGEDFAALQRSVEAQGLLPFVRLCGRLPADQVAAYYHLAAASVEPVYDDDAARGRCPLKLFESWACGAPFVTAAVGDRRLLLGDPPAGLLAHPGNADSLADAILELLTQPALGERLRQLGRQRLPDYTWQRLASALHAAYTSASPGKPATP